MIVVNMQFYDHVHVYVLKGAVDVAISCCNIMLQYHVV